MTATLECWTQDEEEWTFKMGTLFPYAMLEDFNCKKRICWHSKTCRSGAVPWTRFAEEPDRALGEVGSCDVNGTQELDSKRFRDEQPPSDGTSVSRAEWQPATDVHVTQDYHLPILRISFSRNVLPPTWQGLLSSGETGLESHEFSHSVHYELPETLAESIHLQTCRGVFLDWWQCGCTAKMETGPDR